MDIESVPTTNPGWPELVRCVQRELDAIAVGTIITDAWDYKGALRLELEYPSRLTNAQRAEIERLVELAEAVSTYL